MQLDYILDTNILISFFSQKLNTPLPNGKLGVSVITEIELISYPKIDKASEEIINNFLSHIFVVPLSVEIKDLTIQIRKKFGIKLPDAIICATAKLYGATLLTNDKQLLNLPDIDTQAMKVV